MPKLKETPVQPGKFSFTLQEGRKWTSPYDQDDKDYQINKHETNFDSSYFPKPEMITVKELKEILREDFFFKRNLDRKGSVNRVNRNDGFASDMAKPILISNTKEFGKRITDGNHTANMICTLYGDDIKVPVMVYQHTGQRAAKAFALWNKEGIKVLSQEAVFPAQLMYGDKQAEQTFDVLNTTRRTFNKMPIGDPKLNLIATNNRIIKRGYLERSIKVSQGITIDVLNLLKAAYPKDTVDNAILTYALVKGLYKTPVLFEKDSNGLPADLFATWFLIESRKKSQDEWLFQDRRIHNKEAESVFAIVLKEFMNYCSKKHTDKEWYNELQKSWTENFEEYFVPLKKVA